MQWINLEECMKHNTRMLCLDAFHYLLNGDVQTLNTGSAHIKGLSMVTKCLNSAIDGLNDFSCKSWNLFFFLFRCDLDRFMLLFFAYTLLLISFQYSVSLRFWMVWFVKRLMLKCPTIFHEGVRINRNLYELREQIEIFSANSSECNKMLPNQSCDFLFWDDCSLHYFQSLDSLLWAKK